MLLAVFQGPESGGSVAENLDAIAGAAREAATHGARLLVTPEMSVTGYNIGDRAQELAEPADGPIAERIAEIARATGVAVAYGYPERSGGHVHNTVAVIDRDGARLAAYRKANLFGELDRGMFAPGGTGVVQFDLDGVRVGLLICYDVEFPEAVRAHALAGTELVLVPTGLMAPFDIVAEKIVPARAYESQVFVAYVNRTGAEHDLTYCGLSCVVAPDGRDLARAGRTEQLLFADIDPTVLHESRRINTHLQDRRPNLYEEFS